MNGAVFVVHAVAAHSHDGGLDDVVGHLVDGPVRVNDHESLWLGVGQDEEMAAQGGAESSALLLKAVPGATAGGTSLGQVGVAVEQDGQVRQEALGGPEGEVTHLLGAQRSSRPLVGDRGVEVAVGQDDGAALKGGPHTGGDVVGAVGGVQEGLSTRGDVTTVQEEAPDLDAELGAARFTGEDVVDVGGGQEVGEDADLRRLADTVASLEGDEQTGVGRGGGRLSHIPSVAAVRPSRLESRAGHRTKRAQSVSVGPTVGPGRLLLAPCWRVSVLRPKSSTRGGTAGPDHLRIVSLDNDAVDVLDVGR